MRFLSALVTALLVVGCGRSDGPQTAPVKGTLTMAGKPLANVSVTFLPTQRGPIATGNTNENGEFILTTVRPGDGAPIGSHKVALGAAEEGQKRPAIPDRYGRPDTTDLTAEVKAGQTNVFTFEVKP